MTIYERLWRQVVPNIVLIIAQAIIFLSLMETRPGRKKAIRLTVLFTAAVIFVYTFGLFFWDARPSTQWSLLTQTLPALLFFWWLSKYRDIRFLATYCMSDVSIATIDFTFYVLLAQIFGVDNSFWSFPIRCAAMIAGCLLIRRFVSGRYTTALRYLKRGWGLILTVVVLDYAVMALLSAYPTPIAKRPNDLPMCIIVMFFMLTMIFVMIAMIGNMLRAQQLELEEQDLTAGLHIAKQQYESLQDSIKQERVLRHDWKHQLDSMRALCEQKDYDALTALLSSDELAEMPALPVYCENAVANALLGHYAALAAKAGIAFGCRAELPAELPISDAKLGVLLGNALSNAVEAAATAPVGARSIDVFLSLGGGMLLLRVLNSAPEAPTVSDGLPVSSKGEGHGLGFKSMRRLTESAGGLCRWSWADGVFTLKLTLPLH